MTTYYGVRVDIKLNFHTPPQIVTWLSRMALGETFAGTTPEDQAAHQLFNGINGKFPAYDGSRFVRVDECKKHTGYWHLKINSVIPRFDRKFIAWFLNEIQPWVVTPKGTIQATIVSEENDVCEWIFWCPAGKDQIHGRMGRVFDSDKVHPRGYHAAELLFGLGKESETMKLTGCDEEVYKFRRAAVVSPKRAEKRILAKQYNEQYIKSQAEIDAAELAAMEKGL